MANTEKDSTSFTILHLDASARSEGSVTRNLSRRIVEGLMARQKKADADVRVIRRDLADGVPFIDGVFTSAINTPQADRTDAQKRALEVSDELVAELQQADAVVIGVPIYNFAAPAVFKAWFDQVARVGVTFQYTQNGPEGLLEGKKAYLAMASGGTKLGSEIDFASGWLHHALGFIGINDVQTIGAGRILVDDEAVTLAENAIAALAA